MKKLLYILIPILIASCGSDDEPCTCRGMYSFINIDGEENFFKADNVDCETGERPSSPIQDNALFLGCDN